MHKWLSRAAAVPKTLFLELETGSVNVLDPIQIIFASYPFQKLFLFKDCYSLDFVVDDTYEYDKHDIVLPNQLLEHLEELNLDDTSVMFPHDAKLFNLRSLSIAPDCGNFRHYSTAIPWSQIRHLMLSGIYINFHLLFSILKQCLRLEYCKIKDLTPHHRTPAPFQNITLPNLQSFELSLFRQESETHIFGVECIQRLIIPSVNTLQLSLWNVDASVYSRFIEQSGGMPRLHALGLHEKGEPTDIGVLLKLLPHLESITVSRDLRSEIWHDLSMGRIGPSLKHITSPVSSVDAPLDFLKDRYHNAMRSTQQHDGWVGQLQITHLQSATFLLSCDESKFRDMIRNALESNGRGPYQCLRWTSDGDSDRTYTLDDVED